MITREQWQRIKAIFHSAQECAPAERAGFLNQACGDDESIREEVDSLLAADETNEDFLGAPAYELMAGVLAHERAEFVAGQEVGPYTILSSLGAGGMGQVYLAHDPRLPRNIALKLLPPDIAGDQHRVRRFEQEARAASALNHPNVCVIHEIGKTNDGRHFIAMEFIAGVTLRERIAQGPLKLGEALSVAEQIAAALTAVHAAGVIHRDIKPENIMLRSDGYVKVLDFGLAKLSASRSKLENVNDASTIGRVHTDADTKMGTIKYMSPEQLRERPVDERADVWSFGVVLYEMVTGLTPFEAQSRNEVIALILKRQPPKLDFSASELPVEFHKIVSKALQKKRKERYQTVNDLFSDLRRLRQRIESKSPPQPFSEPTINGEVLPANEGRRVRSDLRESPAADKTRPRPRQTSGMWSSALSYLSSTADQVLTGVRRHPKAAVFSGLATVFAIILAVKIPPIRPPGSTPPSAPVIRPLTNAGSSVCAAISPDGKLVAHVEKKDGMQQLIVTGLATSGNSVIVPPDNIEYRGVTFSPDSNYLYFTRVEKSEFGVLYQVALPGGSPRRIKDRVDSPIAFSPTGDRFAFVRFDSAGGEYFLIIAGVDGTGERVIATRQNGNRLSVEGPAWSSDGNTIVCGAGWWDKGYHMNLIEVDLAKGQEKIVGDQNWFSVSQVAWPEGQSGLIISAREQPMAPSQLWRISYPQGQPARMTNDTADYRSVSSSRDANTIVAVQSQRVTRIWMAPNGDAQQGKAIASGVGLAFGLSWTANGKIVFSSMAGNHLNISLIDPDGSNQSQLTVNAGDNYTPATSPDGRFILFASNRTGSFNIWRMNSEDGSDPKQLTFGDGNSYPSCSADGQWVFYDNQSGPRTTVWKVPIDGGDPVQLTEEYARMPVVSPDNQFMACRYYVETGGRQGVAIIPAQGGLPVRLLPIPVRLFQRVQWISNGHALTYIDVVNGVSNIWSYSLDDGSKQQLTNFQTDQIFAYAWSPDNKQLACERGAEVNDVMAIGNQR